MGPDKNKSSKSISNTGSDKNSRHQRHDNEPNSTHSREKKRRSTQSASSSHLFPQRLDAPRPSRATAQAASRAAIKSKYGAPIGLRYDGTGTPIASQYLSMLGGVLKNGTGGAGSSSSKSGINESSTRRQPPSGPIRSRNRDKGVQPKSNDDKSSLSSVLAEAIKDSDTKEKNQKSAPKKLPSSARRRLEKENGKVLDKDQKSTEDEEKQETTGNNDDDQASSDFAEDLSTSNIDENDEEHLDWEDVVAEDDDSDDDLEFEDVLDEDEDMSEDEKARQKRHQLAVEAYKTQTEKVPEKLTIVLGANDDKTNGSSATQVSSRFINPELLQNKKNGKSKKRGATLLSKEEKSDRLVIHKLHLICLLGHVRSRNSWCNDPTILERFRKILPRSIRKELQPDYHKVKKYGKDTQDLMRSRTLLDGLRHAMVYWNENLFRTAKERGIKNVSWCDVYKKVSVLVWKLFIEKKLLTLLLFFNRIESLNQRLTGRDLLN